MALVLIDDFNLERTICQFLVTRSRSYKSSNVFFLVLSKILILSFFNLFLIVFYLLAFPLYYISLITLFLSDSNNSLLMSWHHWPDLLFLVPVQCSSINQMNSNHALAQAQATKGSFTPLCQAFLPALPVSFVCVFISLSLSVYCSLSLFLSGEEKCQDYCNSEHHMRCCWPVSKHPQHMIQ